jgi:hypothetical protein
MHPRPLGALEQPGAADWSQSKGRVGLASPSFRLGFSKKNHEERSTGVMLKTLQYPPPVSSSDLLPMHALMPEASLFSSGGGLLL